MRRSRRASRRSAADAGSRCRRGASTSSSESALDARARGSGRPRRTGRRRSRASAARAHGARPAGRSGRSRGRRASSRPARRRPTSSAPSGPSTSAAWACGMLRASAKSRPIVCSAAETMFDSGAFATTIPRRVAASTSTLSTPTPARPITFRLRRGLDQLGGELRRRADDDRVVGADDLARGRSSASTSTSNRARRSSMPGLGDLLAHENSGALAHAGNRSRRRGSPGGRPPSDAALLQRVKNQRCTN